MSGTGPGRIKLWQVRSSRKPRPSSSGKRSLPVMAELCRPPPGPLAAGLNNPRGGPLLAHPLLPLPRSTPVRLRSVRRPFTPSQPQGPYRLPHRVRDCLTSALTPYRNRDAALTLAVFIGRFWSIPSRVLTAFPIDRRELADRPDLGLTEAQVRGATRALER